MGYADIPGRYAMEWIVQDALARTPHGGIWVEVGVALGRGISYMGETLIREGRSDVQLYAVDAWGGYARNGEQQADHLADDHGDWRLFLDMMGSRASDVLRRLHIIRAPSVRAARAFDAGSVHLCLIDADHAYEAVRDDLAAWIPTIATGGVIGGDDHHETEFPGVPRACREAFGHDSYDVRHDSIWNWPTWRKVMP